MTYTAEQLHTSFDALLDSEYGDKFERKAEVDVKEGSFTVSAKPEIDSLLFFGSKLSRGKNLVESIKIKLTPEDDLHEVFGPKK